MSTAQINRNALSQYFPSCSKSEGYPSNAANQASTAVKDHRVRYSYRSENLDAIMANISSSTAPFFDDFVEITSPRIASTVSCIRNAVEMHPGFELADNLDFFSNAYLGIAECKALANSYKPSKTDIFRELENTTELSSYLLNIYALEQKQRHRAASKVIFQYIETHFAASNLAAVNALLETIDLDNLSQWSIAGLVRFTGRARKHLPCWSSVFSHAKTVLTKKGYDAEKLLVGIEG